MPTTSTHIQALDLRARRFSLPLARVRPMVERWRIELPGNPARARLWWWHDHALLECDAGVAVITGPKLACLPGTDAVARLHPSVSDELVLVDRHGRLCFVRSDRGASSPCFELDQRARAGELLGLAGGELVLNREAGGLRGYVTRLTGDGAWVLERLDRGGATRWRRRGGVGKRLPTTAGLVVVEHPRSIALLDHDSGEPRWQRELPTLIVDGPVLVDDRLWIGDAEGHVRAVQLVDGEPGPALRTMISTPRGILDPDGRLLICAGPSLSIVDLSAARLSGEGGLRRVEGPAPSTSTSTMLLDHRRMVFADRLARVFVVDERTRELSLLWTAPDSVRGLAAVDGALLVLGSRALFALTSE